ncbi:5-methyltetrahydropteroyltriglutamate--homocysteine S-methyltransferase [Paractinoplanes rishiriensis]|uniref:5-methyltetrahydropteroyltriglutamate--homocysteine methyltransferase n=1 Tax=Paractinoplanes rishiriensis TaxID=1050105 RepID=A0A919KA95_9ACTN|nr:5-methyltetrahydropteroyltriglutamate--homocysteine S-methyltransferase [Actinoplanes rishiriensis]GIF01600.1 5-methyltetrahydropteroyltriglutamate--homocysteine methyltransferase [Actinoplanes rishiriensis]
MSTTFGQSTVLGYPRIGGNRELKKAVESYWAGKIDAATLENTAAGLRAEVWRTLRNARLDAIPSSTFSYYDHVLDTAVAVGAIPQRFARLGLPPLDTYFAMARGVDAEPALELTKWFDTNYHYLVPEIDADTTFTANPANAISEYAEAQTLGITTRPVLVGPATFLLLAKGADPFARLEDLVAAYARILTALAEAGVAWVQLDEPAYVADRTPDEIKALHRAYTALGEVEHRPRIFVATYFGELGDALPALLDTPIEALGLDLVAGPGNLSRLAAAGPLGGTTIVAGLIDGHNIWRTDLRAAIVTGATVTALADHVAVSTSCSLLHVPVDLSAETKLDPALSARLAFARQKVDEVVLLLGRALRDGTASLPEPLPPAPAAWRRDDVRARLAALTPADRQRGSYPARAEAQQARLNLPELPTTTIGSFPQTAELRRARAQRRAGTLDEAGCEARMRAEVEHVIRLQERLGLDVLVHGEPERNDMVQYFGDQLNGFATTEFGWVQSYGSRCVRPPIVYGDVARPAPMTVPWSSYAQSLTGKPVKGMLTGPVTILAWSFVRTDQPRADTADQVALALRDECQDLQTAGIRVIQVDEPALRETLPLRKADQKAYLDWAVGAFRLATSGVADDTQIHTHLCYSEFGEVITAIDALDALDVTSIEASRSKMEVLDDLAGIGYRRGVGPGVWDIHSPRVPSHDEVIDALRRAVAAVPARRLWVNPDCGLKTRGYPEVEASLKRLIAAAAAVRGN